MIMEISDRLRNGAYVLDIADVDGRVKIVLAFWPDNYMPFITWQCTNAGDTVWGHYHETLDSAIAEFKQRFKAVLHDSLQPV
jgi:hypothetical protein